MGCLSLIWIRLSFQAFCTADFVFTFFFCVLQNERHVFEFDLSLIGMQKHKGSLPVLYVKYHYQLHEVKNVNRNRMLISHQKSIS